MQYATLINLSRKLGLGLGEGATVASLAEGGKPGSPCAPGGRAQPFCFCARPALSSGNLRAHVRNGNGITLDAVRPGGQARSPAAVTGWHR